MPFTESNYENCFLSLLEDLGYTHKNTNKSA